MLAFKSSTTHHAEGNSMASPTQTVVGKGTSNLLIAEGLLKILSGLGSLFPPKSLTNSHPQNGKSTKCNHYYVNTIPLVMEILNTPYRVQTLLVNSTGSSKRSNLPS